MKILAMIRIKKFLPEVRLYEDTESDVPKLEMEYLFIKEIDTELDKDIEFIGIIASADD